MALAMGFVGLPNVGKSTLFNALTQAKVASANYPFCTIDPNNGQVPVPDRRLIKLTELVKPQQVIPTYLKCVDIAGLVAGASQGEGLGNQFLGHIRDTHAIAHVLRAFHDPDVIHVANHLDPMADLNVVETELALADLDTLTRSQQKKTKIHATDELKKMGQIIDEAIAWLDSGHMLRTFPNRQALAHLQLLTAKPMLYIANVDEQIDHDLVAAIQEHAEQQQCPVVMICCQLEAELAELPTEEQQDFLQSLGWQEPGLHQVIRESYRLLGYATFFTAGVKEVRAWTFDQGMLAPQAAGIIHSDIQKGFIRAEVISYDDFVRFGGEQGAKEAGRWRLEGKDYVVQDGDVIHFRHNS